MGSIPAGYKVNLDGRELKVSTDGRFLLGLDRDQDPQITLTLIAPDGKRTQQQLAVTARQYNIQYVEGVPQRTVSPPADQLQRIRREAALVRKARDITSDRLDFLDGFIQPLEGPVTGVYGSQRYYNGNPGRPHFGVDYAGPVGTPVKAPASGVVRLAYDDMFFSGGTLIIDHGFGLTSSFLHLSKLLVTDGQQVMRGEIVAEVGATGRATGPHLDWRMNWHHTRIDPELVLANFPAH